VKLSGSYNVFNGEELLLQSLTHSRQFCDHISIIYQNLSNTGNIANPLLGQVLEEANRRRLFDDIILFEPDLTKEAVTNEAHKRRIGLEAARARGCDHFITLDADEFYVPKQVNQFKEAYLKSMRMHLVVTCPSWLHIKSPRYRSLNPDTTRVILWSRITDGLTNEQTDCEVNFKMLDMVDPTRRFIDPNITTSRMIYEADAGQISMYHMNLVRTDGLASKLANTSSHKNIKFIEEVESIYRRWKYGDDLSFPGKPSMKIGIVDDVFNLEATPTNPPWKPAKP
jgi:hypothetical protein